ncbi:MAG TPA: hypothetical protein VFM03_04675 [Candidatus Limnocylindria bacterium]|nr:hypothetical protein [Candidatus Limnocylindria bacterium]
MTGTIAVAAALVGCGGPALDSVVREAQVAPEAVVRLDDGRAVAARLDGPLVRVVDFVRGPDGWRVEERAGATSPRGGSVSAVSGGGEMIGPWPTFVFGAAPPGVARVVVAGIDGVGGQVVDGAWVVASRVENIPMGQIAWQFLDAGGGVVLSGEGLYQAP